MDRKKILIVVGSALADIAIVTVLVVLSAGKGASGDSPTPDEGVSTPSETPQESEGGDIEGESSETDIVLPEREF